MNSPPLSTRCYVQFLYLDLPVVVTHCCLHSWRQQTTGVGGSRYQQAEISSVGTSRHLQATQIPSIPSASPPAARQGNEFLTTGHLMNKVLNCPTLRTSSDRSDRLLVLAFACNHPPLPESLTRYAAV